MKQRLKRLAARHLRSYAERLDPPPTTPVVWWTRPVQTTTSANTTLTWTGIR